MSKSIRRIDELGRLVLPSEIREALDLNPKDWMVITLKGEELIIKKFVDSCAFCESDEALIKFKDKFVCERCCNDLRENY